MYGKGGSWHAAGGQPVARPGHACHGPPTPHLLPCSPIWGCRGAGAVELAVGHPAALPADTVGTRSLVADTVGTGFGFNVGHCGAAMSVQVLLRPTGEAFPSPTGSSDKGNCEIPGNEKNTVGSGVKIA
jgi:hypothetical protein